MSDQIDTSTLEFQNALSLVRFTRQSVFLTGKAGTGKSTFLRYVCRHVRKRHVVLAPTGIAAINAGGCTMHSFFKLPFHPLLPDDPRYASPARLKDFLKYNRERINLIRKVELIIIDEISMVRADIIDFIDRILRVYSGNMREPFGGKQMLFIGDVFQLEPVVKADEREILLRFYPNAYFFSARVFAQMKLVSVELAKVYRQTDRTFIRVLDHIRCNSVSPDELRLINTRVQSVTDRPDASPGAIHIVLATRRDNVDYINRTRLAELQGESVQIRGTVQGEFPDTSLPTQLLLELKPGAQIIFVKNDPEHRWVNGTLGIVSDIDVQAGLLHVGIEGGGTVMVEPAKWSNVRYTYNEAEKRIEEEELGTFSQLPVRLAWAITIHKSQGLTFRHVTIDFGGGTFAGGQAYVALSRCTSLEGIVLKEKITPSDIFVRPEIIRFAESFNDSRSVQLALQAAKADSAYHACVEAFDRGDMEACLQQFFVAIHARYDIERPEVRRLIRRKLGLINTLRRRADEDRLAVEQMQRKLNKCAREYYEMGNLCATKAHDPKAAIANFRKAISLDPSYTDAHVRLGVTLLDMGENHQAMKALNKAVALSPASFKAVYQRGRAYMSLSLYEQALGDLCRATSLCDTHPGAHKLMGDCFSALGDEDKAALYWEIASQLRKQKRS